MKNKSLFGRFFSASFSALLLLIGTTVLSACSSNGSKNGAYTTTWKTDIKDKLAGNIVVDYGDSYASQFTNGTSTGINGGLKTRIIDQAVSQNEYLKTLGKNNIDIVSIIPEFQYNDEVLTVKKENDGYLFRVYFTLPTANIYTSYVPQTIFANDELYNLTCKNLFSIVVDWKLSLTPAAPATTSTLSPTIPFNNSSRIISYIPASGCLNFVLLQESWSDGAVSLTPMDTQDSFTIDVVNNDLSPIIINQNDAIKEYLKWGSGKNFTNQWYQTTFDKSCFSFKWALNDETNQPMNQVVDKSYGAQMTLKFSDGNGPTTKELLFTFTVSNIVSDVKKVVEQLPPQVDTYNWTNTQARSNTKTPPCPFYWIRSNNLNLVEWDARDLKLYFDWQASPSLFVNTLFNSYKYLASALITSTNIKATKLEMYWDEIKMEFAYKAQAAPEDIIQQGTLPRNCYKYSISNLNVKLYYLDGTEEKVYFSQTLNTLQPFTVAACSDVKLKYMTKDNNSLLSWNNYNGLSYSENTLGQTWDGPQGKELTVPVLFFGAVDTDNEKVYGLNNETAPKIFKSNTTINGVENEQSFSTLWSIIDSVDSYSSGRYIYPNDENDSFNPF